MARRVNKRFLVVFGVVVVLGAVAAVVVGLQIRGGARKEQAKKQIEQSNKLVEEADKEETSVGRREKLTAAIISYEQALASDTKNPDLCVKLGDAYSKMAPFDPGLVGKSRQRWTQALEIDPAYLPALKRLMESYYQEVLIRPFAAAFGQVEDRAAAIHKIDPTDKRAQALLYIAPLHQWLANIETNPDKIKTGKDELAAMIAANPNDPDVADWVFWTSQATAKEGVDASRGSQTQIANERFKQAIGQFEDALKVQDGNAWMHYRFYELLATIRQDDRERDNTQRYTEKMKREIERARELAKPEDANYVKINIGAHEWALSLREIPKAEQILVDTQNAKQKDQRVRLALARLWRYNREKRASAIDLLRLPIEESGGFEGVEALRRRQLESDTLVDLTTMLIDDLVEGEQRQNLSVGDREAKLKEIEAYYARGLDRAGETSQVLKLRGKVELLRGGNDAQVKAIKSFERAQKQYQIEHQGREETELMFLLARAYTRAGMTGQAKQQLLKYMEKNNNSVPVRLMLAQILIREGDLASARTHVAWLEGQAPEEPEIVRLAISAMDPVKDKDRIVQYVGKLPERTRTDQLSKAQVALAPPSNNLEEAVRLYKQVLEKDPADFEPLNAAKELLVALNRKPEAMALLKAGKAAKADEKIDLLIQQLDGATPEQMAESGDKLIRKMNADDPLKMQLKLYEFKLMAARVTGKPDADPKAARAEAFKHLEAAEKLKPDDTQVMDLMFSYNLQEQNWEKAASYAERLGLVNADQVNGLIYKFRLAMVKGDVRDAVEHATAMTQKFPEFARSWVFLAQSLQASGRLDEAVSRYGDALERQGENPDALSGIISCLYQLNKAVDAGRYIDQGVKSFPNNAWFRDQKKAWEMNFGDPALALGGAKAELDAKPDDVQKWIQLGRVQMAAARKRDGNFAKYIADAKTTFTQAAGKWPAERLIWAFLLDIADVTRDFAYGESVLKEMAARPEFKDKPDAQLAMADFYLRFNKTAEAETALKALVDTFKTDVSVRRKLAAFYTQNKRYDDALKLLDPASTEAIVRQQIVEILMLKGDFERAEQMLAGLLTGEGAKDGQLHALMGVVKLNRNQKDAALAQLNEALALDPKNQAALYARGQIRLRETPPQIEEAIRDLMVLRDSNPGHIEARITLAEAFRQKGQPDAAAKELEEVLKRAPGRRDVRVTLCGIYAAAKPPQWNDVERHIRVAEELEPKEAMWKRMAAKMLSARNQHDNAAAKLREALAVAKSDVERGELVRDYMDILENGKNWSQLQIEIDQLFKTAPQVAKDGWWAYVKRAIARKNLGDKGAAMKDFETAFTIAQEQGNSDVLFGIVDRIASNLGSESAVSRVLALVASTKGTEQLRWKVVLGYLYFTSQDPEKAVATIEEVAGQLGEMSPKDKLTAMTVSGTVYMLAGKFEKSRAMYEGLLKERPDDVAALNNMACLLAERTTPPDFSKALEYSNRANDLLSKRGVSDASILDTLGWIQVLMGGPSLDKGIELLNQAIKLNEIPEAHYHLAEAFLRKKFPEEAKKSLARADELVREKLEKTPNDASVKELKEKVNEAILRAEKAVADARSGAPANP